MLIKTQKKGEVGYIAGISHPAHKSGVTALSVKQQGKRHPLFNKKFMRTRYRVKRKVIAEVLGFHGSIVILCGPAHLPGSGGDYGYLIFRIPAPAHSYSGNNYITA